MDLSERIRQIRKENELTQKQVAEMLGITQNNYHYIETGKIKIDSKYITKLATVFNVSTDYLLGIEEKDETTAAIKDAYRALFAREHNEKSFFASMSEEDKILFEFLKIANEEEKKLFKNIIGLSPAAFKIISVYVNFVVENKNKENNENDNDTRNQDT